MLPLDCAPRWFRKAARFPPGAFAFGRISLSIILLKIPRKRRTSMTDERRFTSSVISDVNQLAMDWAKEHAGELLGTKWYDGEKSPDPSEKWPVSESTRMAIRKIMTEAFGRETRMSDLVQRVQDATGFPKERAEVIADTEVSFAQSRGNLEAWQRMGVVRSIRWSTSMLHTERDACDLNAEAGAVPIGHLFPSGDPAPPAHIGCRCVAVIAELNETKRKH